MPQPKEKIVPRGESIKFTSIKLRNGWYYFMKIIALIACFLLFNPLFGQHVSSSKSDSLINELYQLQTKKQSFYNIGQFCTQRGYGRVQDNTIFFDALIAFTLQGLSAEASAKSQTYIDSICKNVKNNYPYYRNISQNHTYNFWKTNPPYFFPNGRILSGFSHFQIPDDADCTAMIFLTDSSLTKHATWLQNKLTEHANLSHSKIKNTCKPFRGFKAYSTWFGKRMPIEFDICVQSNVLLFIYKNKLPLTNQDQETLSLLHEQIITGAYLKNAHYFSPSYKKRSVVLYHLARLMESATIPSLQDCRAIVKKDIETELTHTKKFMDRVILSTALIRMKGTPLPIDIPSNVHKEMDSYVFFRANLFSSYARPSLKFITKSYLFDIPFYSKAYCLALLAEYEQLMAKRIRTTR